MSASFFGGLVLGFEVKERDFLLKVRSQEKCPHGHVRPGNSGPFCSLEGSAFQTVEEFKATEALERLYEHIGFGPEDCDPKEALRSLYEHDDKGPVFHYGGKLFVGVNMSYLNMFGGGPFDQIFDDVKMTGHRMEVERLLTVLGFENRPIYLIHWIQGSL